jgi:hypothetical protein
MTETERFNLELRRQALLADRNQEEVPFGELVRRAETELDCRDRSRRAPPQA